MTDRARNSLILLVVIAALIGAGLAAVFKSPVLGLDLQGGTEVTLLAKPEKGQTITADQLDQSVSIIRNRVDKLGVSEPEIRKESGNRIVVALAGLKDPLAAQRVIGSTGQLIMIPFAESLAPGVSRGTGTQGSAQISAKQSLYKLLKASQTQSGIDNPDAWYAFDKKTHRNVLAGGGNEATQAALLKDLKQRGISPDDVEILKLPHNTIAVSCAPDHGCPGAVSTAGNSWYLFQLPANKDLILNGRDIHDARQDIDTTGGGNIVTMQFSDKGARQFQDITRELAQNGRSNWALAGSQAGTEQNFFETFAVILDNKLESTPSIDFTKYGGGIDPSIGGAEISSIPTLSEAKNIALVLQTGSLPIRFVPQEISQVSATLGKQSLHQGLIAGLFGLLAVMIYLIVIYRFLGVVADLALLIYGAFFYGIALLIPITLTLPGIAGAILTIGVAADANVVIFERIKEEVRLGRSVRSAISTGYSKGFHTIIDANVVTLITAAVLFLSGSGTVKGFAFTLAVGVLVSTFTAVFATREMLNLLAGRRWFNNASFMGASGQKVRWRMDIIGRRNMWFAISALAVLISLGSLAVKGLNQGIDFKGGTRITTSTTKPATVDQVRNVVASVNPSDSNLSANHVVVQGLGASKGQSLFNQFSVQTKTLPVKESNDVLAAINTSFGPTKNEQINSVSASFGSQILRDAIYAVIFSMILITGYVTARFEFKFALPAIIALLHDVLITVGVYSLTGREVTSATVAAVLTVLGYSLYDTIIVFDRVRENTPLLRKNSYAQIVNVSLWETLTRSINTTLITVVPLLALLLFGGATLKDFAFALLIGIISGAYSSLFVASPLLSLWKESEPEYKRRAKAAEPIHKATLGDDIPAKDAVADKERVPAMSGAREATADADDAAATSDDAAPPPGTTGTPPPQDDVSAREAARQRRLERRRNRPHGRPR